MKPTVFNYADYEALLADNARLRAELDAAVKDIVVVSYHDRKMPCPVCTYENAAGEEAMELGNICNPYADNPEIPLQYSSYGKTADEAETEASEYYSKLRRLIRKQTSDYKIKDAEAEQEERKELLARLAELGGAQAGEEKKR